MYVVVPVRTPSGIDYDVIDNKDGEKIGSFDCDKWAQTFADEKNAKKED